MLPYNKPDILIWNKETKIFSVIKISCPADVNITQKKNEKLQKYVPLLRNLQMMYNDYKFEKLLRVLLDLKCEVVLNSYYVSGICTPKSHSYVVDHRLNEMICCHL